MVGLAHIQEVLKKAQGKKRGLTELEAKRAIQCHSRTSWPAGTTIEDILGSLEECKLILRRADGTITT